MMLLVAVILTCAATTLNAVLTVASWRYRIRTDAEHMAAHSMHAEVHSDEIEMIETLHHASHLHMDARQTPMVRG